MLIDETLDTISKRITWMERAAAIPGLPRERLIALAEAEEQFCRLHAQHDLALQSVLIMAQLGQMRSEREDTSRQAEHRLTDLLTDIIRDAIRQGDLPVRAGLNSQELAFTVWALAFGTRALMHTRVATRNLGIEDGLRVGREALHLLLDSLGWRPLSSQWDYEKTRHQARVVPFPKEGRSGEPSVSNLTWHRSRLRLAAEAEE
jgi:hypothetical protein